MFKRYSKQFANSLSSIKPNDRILIIFNFQTQLSLKIFHEISKKGTKIGL